MDCWVFMPKTDFLLVNNTQENISDKFTIKIRDHNYSIRIVSQIH